LENSDTINQSYTLVSNYDYHLDKLLQEIINKGNKKRSKLQQVTAITIHQSHFRPQLVNTTLIREQIITVS